MAGDDKVLISLTIIFDNTNKLYFTHTMTRKLKNESLQIESECVLLPAFLFFKYFGGS